MTSTRARLQDSGLTGLLVVVSAAALLAVGAVGYTAAIGFKHVGTAFAFGAFIALGEMARITLPGGRDAAPVGTAGALAYTLVISYDGHDFDQSALQVVAVVAVAMIVGVLPHVIVGRAPTIDTLARRLITVGFAAMLFQGTRLDDDIRSWQSSKYQAIAMVAVVAVTLVFDALVAAAVRASSDGAPFPAVLRNELSAQGGIGSAIGATGALIALAASIMGWYALPVFVIPLLLTQFAFRRYAAIRATYLQTIRALSRVTELGGYTESGHSRRVSQLAVAVGRELGMTDAELLELEYAALMHDIGQLSLPEPIPGGATVVAAPTEQRRIAGMGADVIRQTGVLDRVATIVEQQAEPYRRAHQTFDETVPLASRIIKAVNAYDDLVGESSETGRRLDALERLRLGMAYEYDPRVVDSLANTIERSTRLGP
ncbi:MAG TPA: HD domain-containing phosphohydrolase [Actinomycetes bacterium]